MKLKKVKVLTLSLLLALLSDLWEAAEATMDSRTSSFLV